MDAEIKRQLDILSDRSVDLVSSEVLAEKLRTSLDTGEPLRVKYGADPSAPDIHLGHVVGLNKLREFQDLGHTVVFIIGDFTGMIGDPSGKSATRPALSIEDVRRNAETYQDQAFKVLDPAKTEVRFNSEWLSPMSFEQVIKLSSKVTVAQMLARDDFAKRYAENAPISLVEFIYPLIQAYDSVMVEADIELGGTDQLFNLLLGREIQQSHGQPPQTVMTLPLLEGLDGVQKMSKSLNNYIGLTDSPKDMFGKAMSVSDELMWRYMRLVLCMPQERLTELENQVRNGDLHPRKVKDDLARSLVARFHSDADADSASLEFKRVFSAKELPADMPTLSIASLHTEDGKIGLLSLLKEAGLVPSNKEARRLIEQGAVRIDDNRIENPALYIVPKSDSIIRVGKRGFLRLD